MAGPGGAFNDRARAAIREAGLGRCAGCGRSEVTMQHRRARGMGGTSEISIGHPANGVPLCGDGTRGCHGWAERHPAVAVLLGWRLRPGQPALGAPWWCRAYRGWVAWIERDGCPGLALLYADLGDLDDPEARAGALARFQASRGDRRP